MVPYSDSDCSAFKHLKMRGISVVKSAIWCTPSNCIDCGCIRFDIDTCLQSFTSFFGRFDARTQRTGEKLTAEMSHQSEDTHTLHNSIASTAMKCLHVEKKIALTILFSAEGKWKLGRFGPREEVVWCDRESWWEIILHDGSFHRTRWSTSCTVAAKIILSSVLCNTSECLWEIWSARHILLRQYIFWKSSFYFQIN